MKDFIETIESKCSLIGLGILLAVAVTLEMLGHLSPGMVSVIEWVGGAYLAACSAAHIGAGMGPKA